ncbi:MAG: hypothetical protein UU32_C0021G0004 [Candidatus Woesebacteria bacterium GW2011_GWB1_41_10]|uniref:Glycerophosphoryl diester phosphodiesterase membrane domain-containing protein n=1 Tax=Candidatus Woesebacteria bacterium GW2011_GWB1_41_10 TaxID=1618577 RepID=A0A0G0UAZ5_9BACT|nr:MAG: hypothetical protein UU32_C0021G0004 [Candidatus Woesebacteria bacterium GW2011_GWB1_41_10]
MKYIKGAVEIFLKKKNFIYFLKIQAFLLPLAFISFVWSLILTFKAENLAQSLSTNPVFMFSSVLLNLLNAVIYLFVTVASIEAIRRVSENSSLSVQEAFLVAKAKAWKFLLIGILKGAILLIGFLLLIIPGIIFSVWFAFSGMEIVLNKTGVKESLLKSKALVIGRFWPVLGKLFVIGIFVTVLQIIFTILPYGIGNLMSPVFGILFLLPIYLLFKELEAHKA